MIRYPMIVPGTHPAAAHLLGLEDLYVEAYLDGPTVGFAVVDGKLWVDMPVSSIGVLDDKPLNPNYVYIGTLYKGSIVLTDILNKRGQTLEHEPKFVEADRLGMECVQLLHMGALTSPEFLHELLQQAPDGLIVKPAKPERDGQAGTLAALIQCVITPDMFQQMPTDTDPAAQGPAADGGNLIEVANG